MSIPNATQGLMILFARLISDPETVPAAETLMTLCEDIPGDRVTSGDMMVVVMQLRNIYPTYADRILQHAIRPVA
jgi:hypothetical protein